MQQGPRHFSSIASPFNVCCGDEANFLSLISAHQFASAGNEDPYTHLSTFYELCGTMGIPEGEKEVVYLRLFLFSLTGKAKAWLQSHPNQSLTS